MALIFRGNELRPVLTEARNNQCSVLLVKDHGVYWLSEIGERRPDGRQKLIAFAVGCNPDIDDFDAWWNLARRELGGDDFGENFSLNDRIFERLLNGDEDLQLTATSTHLQLELIPSRSATQ